MFPLTTTLVLSFLCHLANAVSCHDSALDITAIENDFENASIVPDLLPSFFPSALMNVSYPAIGTIFSGENVSTQQVAPTPNVAITPASPGVATVGNFTIMMVDAGAAGTNGSSGLPLLWLVNYATLQDVLLPSGCPSLNVSTDGGLAIVNYTSPLPFADTGMNRYVILVFPQPPSFSPPKNPSDPINGIDLTFNLTDYMASSNLSPPIAGMFFEIQSATNTTANTTAPLSSGTAVATPSSTSPVSSSLANATTPLSSDSAVATWSSTSPVSSSLANVTTPPSSAVDTSTLTSSGVSSSSTVVRRRRRLGRVTV
ncbi:phosphatidylethanolamine-binding protein [Russula emetica]|nr:phosphatidylethanolamine-binding protein [Russula emetica]